MVQVYGEALQRRHYASRWSAAFCFRLASHVAILVLTFIFVHSSQGFWLKESTFTAQPAVRFTHDALLLLEGKGPGQEIFWSTFPTLNSALANKLAAVEVRATETDSDHDGNADVIDVSARVSGAGPVHSVKLLLQFRYQIQGRIRMQMQSLAYIHHASPLPGSELHVDGELRLRQRRPLSFDNNRVLYDVPALAPGGPSGQSLDSRSVQMQSILRDYLDRNETTEFVSSYAVWQAGYGTDFTIFERIRIPPFESVAYIPGLMEVLKYAWIQFLAVWILLLYLLSWVEYVTFRYRVLETRVVSDLQTQKQHRF